METFVEVPHPALGGWAPCPYARKARLDRDFEVRIGRNPFEDLIAVSYGTLPCSVVIFAYDPELHPYNEFHTQIEFANTNHLVPRNMIALEDHPADADDDRETGDQAVTGVNLRQSGGIDGGVLQHHPLHGQQGDESENGDVVDNGQSKIEQARLLRFAAGSSISPAS
jgi:hypothetical protein